MTMDMYGRTIIPPKELEARRKAALVRVAQAAGLRKVSFQMMNGGHKTFRARLDASKMLDDIAKQLEGGAS